MFSNAEFTDYILVPLIAWAHILEQDRWQNIVGICLWDSRDGEMDVVEDNDYFMSYVGPGEVPMEGEELAAELEFTREFVEEMMRDEEAAKDSDELEDED